MVQVNCEVTFKYEVPKQRYEEMISFIEEQIDDYTFEDKDLKLADILQNLINNIKGSKKDIDDNYIEFTISCDDLEQFFKLFMLFTPEFYNSSKSYEHELKKAEGKIKVLENKLFDIETIVVQ